MIQVTIERLSSGNHRWAITGTFATGDEAVSEMQKGDVKKVTHFLHSLYPHHMGPDCDDTCDLTTREALEGGTIAKE